MSNEIDLIPDDFELTSEELEQMHEEIEASFRLQPFYHACPDNDGEHIIGDMPEFLKCKCFDHSKKARRRKFDMRREIAMEKINGPDPRSLQPMYLCDVCYEVFYEDQSSEHEHA